MENRPIIGNFITSTLYGLDEITYESSPSIGKEVFEMWKGAVHPGHDIHVLENTLGKSKNEIETLLRSMDPRVLQNMPQEVVDAIDSGDISHIYRTNPGASESFTSLPDAVKKSLGGPENTGSIYFRRSSGETARWKLPEIASGDAAWNANQGGAIFSDATVYLDDTYPMSKTNGFTKAYGKNQMLEATDDLKALMDSNPYFAVQGNIERVKSGKKTLLVAREAEDIKPKVTVSSVPTDAEIKAAMGNPPSPSVEPDTPKNLTPQQQALIDTMKAEKAANEAFAVESLEKQNKQ